MSAKQQTSKGNRFLKWLWLIPILVLGYIGYVNLLPFGGTLTYLIDVGGEDTGGEARITGPFDRISDKIIVDSTTFRDVKKSEVYFELEDPRLEIADEVEVSVRFKDNFPGDAKFILGTRNVKKSYYWKDIYVPFYGQLTDLLLLAEDGNIKVYATEEESIARFGSVDEFQQNLPLGSIVARNDRDLTINQRVLPEDWGEIDVSEFVTGNAFPIPLVRDIDENSWLETDTSLRGSYTLYFFASDDTMELQITKRDLNWYEGEDMLDVLIYSLDGTLKAQTTIPDDGDATKNTTLGDPQYWTLRMDNLERGTYRLLLKPIGVGNDLLITRLGLSQAKLVVSEKIFLAGNFYLGEELQSMVVWCYLFSEGKIKFRLGHESVFQTIIISGEDYNETLSIDDVGEWVTSELLKPGIYQITAEKGDVGIEAPKGYFAFTEDSLFLPTSSSNREEKGSLLINTVLRGEHTFWTYVSNGLLELAVTKQDLNWYEGPDELKIGVYSLSERLEGSTIIPDDGDESDSHQRGTLQSESLRIHDLEQGAYRIELKGWHDLLINGIEINQEKLVVDKKLYLGEINVVYFEGRLIVNPVSLYGRNFRGDELKFRTWHNAGLQRVTIRDRSFYTEVNVNKLETEFNTTLEVGSYQLIVLKQDILIESNGYYSFTPNSFFLPKRCEVVDLEYDLSWVRENADYMIIDYKDYAPPVEDNGWLVAQATWKREDLFIEDNKLSFCFNVPQLGQTEEQDRNIPVDWIEIKLKILPIWGRIGQRD